MDGPWGSAPEVDVCAEELLSHAEMIMCSCAGPAAKQSRSGGSPCGAR